MVLLNFGLSFSVTDVSEQADLFTPEREKKEGRLEQKVVEIDRTVYMRKRP